MNRALLYVFCLVGLAGLAACSESENGDPQGPFADPWTVMPSSELDPVRDFMVVHGIVHNHSPYSHDACDDEPFVDGVRDEQCCEDVRAGMCETLQDFVFLTDHDNLFAHYEYPEVLLYADGDALIERDGLPVANRVACPDGHQVIVAAGTESAMMPIGLEHHVGADLDSRRAAYGEVSADAGRALQDAGALVFLQHTEGWEVDTILSLPIDGIAAYNLHQTLMDNLGAALEMLLRLESEPETLPVMELAIIMIFLESEADLYRWALAVQQGPMPAVLATDAHRNVFPNPSPDGERLDSFRRMMHWFSNYVLVPRGEVDDAVLKEAIGHGRMYGAFDYLGYPVGFDFRAEAGGRVHEMGDSVPSSGVELVLHLPHVYRLDPELDPPDITGRILRATAEGEWEEVASGSDDLREQIEQMERGVYRAEVRMVPHHLRQWLGTEPDEFVKELIWVYSNPIYVE